MLTSDKTGYIIKSMKAEIIGIGTELLLGDVVNSNAAYLSQKLAGLGIDVYYHSTVGDNPTRLASSVKTALSRSDLVITTGGLGPTVDDITAQTLQPYTKKNTLILKNNVGTAPGLFTKLPDKKFLIALPGPPRELKPMFEKYAIPLLKKVSGAKSIIKSRVIKITGLSEPKVNKKVKSILKLKPPVTVGIYVKLGEVKLKITAKAASEKNALKLIAPVEKDIKKRLGDYIFGIDDQTLEGAVGELLARHKKTLAVAESCTGGLIANRITDVPGSSRYFKMGIVAYDNGIKTKFLLDVGSEQCSPLQKYGAVSRQVAIKMAQGIRKLANSDIGLSTTGIAGPAGKTKTKPVGLVFIALSTPKQTICKKYHFAGARTSVKYRTSQAALDLLRKSVQGNA